MSEVEVVLRREAARRRLAGEVTGDDRAGSGAYQAVGGEVGGAL